MDDWFEDVWSAVPEGAEPEAFALRRDFLLAHLPPGAIVCDVGCGEGAFSAAMLAAGAHPIAVDVAEEPLRRLRARFPEVEDVRRARTGEPLPLDDREAEAVWAGEVVEHVVDVGGFLGEVRRVLRPGGRLLLTTPDHPLRRRLRLALSPRAFEEHFDPRADHVRFFTEATLTIALSGAGFGRVEVERRGGRLLTRAW